MGHTTKSKIIGSFKESGERVRVVEEVHIKGNTETLMSRDLEFDLYGEKVGLKKGKAVTIISIENKKARISFKDSNLKKVFATIDSNYLEKVDENIWFKVERNSGEVGWVFGKFIGELNIY